MMVSATLIQTYGQALQRSVLGHLPTELLDRPPAPGRDAVGRPHRQRAVSRGRPPTLRAAHQWVGQGLPRRLLGRQVTIRYMSPGSISGSSLVVLGVSADVRVQAVADVVGVLINVAVLRSLAQSERPRVAWALATEVARSQDEIVRAFGASAFGSLRQRLARHLLDLAAARFGVGSTLVAPVTRQHLADAVGSSREVVARVLRELREAGLVGTTRGGVALLDPTRLHAEVEPDPSVYAGYAGPYSRLQTRRRTRSGTQAACLLTRSSAGASWSSAASARLRPHSARPSAAAHRPSPSSPSTTHFRTLGTDAGTT